MALEIRFNKRTGKYTLEKFDEQTGEETHLPHPPKYSGTDKYGKYRREVKKPMWKKEGLY